ncbi:MAG: hypothetical protein IJ088_15785 [Clostridia bacterium]|nr:hypothetical protein [Clostridia bacterium]
MIINRLQPQALNKLIRGIPAFSEAAKAGKLSDQTGMVVSSYSSPAYVDRKSSGDDFSSSLYVSINTLIRTDGNGQVQPQSTKEKSKLYFTMVHEMVHQLMNDYTRQGFAVTDVLSVNSFVSLDGGQLTWEEYAIKKEHLLYPEWFVEGTANLVAGQYWSETSYLSRMGFIAKDGTPLDCTAETIYDIYLENAEQLDTDKLSKRDNARYDFGPIAIAWLSDLQAQADGLVSAFSWGSDGSLTSVRESTLLMGFSRLLERLHTGETLDDVIRRLTRARFLDTEDFSHRFICGDENGMDQETASFAAAWMNYLAKLSREQGRIVSGSILEGLSSDCYDFLDENKEETCPFYHISQSGFALSNIKNSDVNCRGKSRFSVYTYRQGASYLCSEGANSVYQQGSGEALRFVIQRTVPEEKLIPGIWRPWKWMASFFPLFNTRLPKSQKVSRLRLTFCRPGWTSFLRVSICLR